MKNDKISVMLTINKMIIGGAEQQFLELVRGIDKNRFRVIVVSLYSGGALEGFIREVPGIEYICLNRKGKLDFSPLVSIFRLLRKYNIEVVQPFLTPATFFTLIPAIVNRTRAKIVTERATQRKVSLGYRFYLRMEDFLTRSADRIVPNSGAGKLFLLGRGINPARIKVIYNGINMERLKPDMNKVEHIKSGLDLPADGRIIGISASLTPPKDHATFLRAARLISQKIPEVKFALLGDGQLLPTLRDMTIELGIEDKVSFLGNQTDVSSYLAAFDIACLCSSELEGCSNAILEAMALGKPVVATDAGGNKELVQDGVSGFIVPTKDPERLAEALLTCLREPERAGDMGRRGKEIILERFSLEHMVRNYETLYEEILQENRAG